MNREFFNSSGEYFFAEVIQTLPNGDFVIIKDGVEMRAYPALGNMKAVSIEDYAKRLALLEQGNT